MKGGQQPVPVFKVKTDFLGGGWYWGVLAQEMTNGLGIAANPGKGFPPKGRDQRAGVIANKAQGATPRQKKEISATAISAA